MEAPIIGGSGQAVALRDGVATTEGRAESPPGDTSSCLPRVEALGRPARRPNRRRAGNVIMSGRPGRASPRGGHAGIEGPGRCARRWSHPPSADVGSSEKHAVRRRKHRCDSPPELRPPVEEPRRARHAGGVGEIGDPTSERRRVGCPDRAGAAGRPCPPGGGGRGGPADVAQHPHTRNRVPLGDWGEGDDFPEPEGPTRTVIPTEGTVTSMSCSTARSPRRSDTPTISTTGTLTGAH